jgi:hypothetical protein
MKNEKVPRQQQEVFLCIRKQRHELEREAVGIRKIVYVHEEQRKAKGKLKSFPLEKLT